MMALQPTLADTYVEAVWELVFVSPQQNGRLPPNGQLSFKMNRIELNSKYTQKSLITSRQAAENGPAIHSTDQHELTRISVSSKLRG